MRLRHLYTGELTWRELASLVRGLSPQAGLRAVLNDGRPEATGEQIILADVFDMLQHVDWHIQAANASKKSELPKRPKPYPRWWEQGKPGRKHSPQRVARIEDARKRAAARRQAITEGRIA